MKFRVSILAGRIEETAAAAIRAFVSGRKDGAYTVEVKSAARFTSPQRSKAHIWLHQLEQATGMSMELLKQNFCRDLGWGEWKPWRGVDRDGEQVERQEFVRRSTEEMTADDYRDFMDRIRYAAEFCGVVLGGES